jgi:Zn-dependent peptidase ImmA (M78 family)/transcriptional regulator with XRE-family HTH domain
VIGVSRQVISQYEHGQTAPSPDKLYVIAAKLGLPVAFFLLPVRPDAERVVFFRSQAAATKGEQTKAERRLEWLGDLVNYLSRFVEFPEVAFPKVSERSAAPWTGAAIEEAAHEARAQWGVGSGPVANMVALAERHGAIATRGIVETERIDAFSVRIGDRPAIFLGADKDSAVRSRFDAAHELGHHVLHSDMPSKRLMSAVERKNAEGEAHRFASAFLLPASEFARDLRAPTLEGMLIAKSRWGVSIGAMIQRCADIEILRPDEAERLWVARAKRGWSRREPLDDELPLEQPALLRGAVELMVAEGIRTPEEIALDVPLGPSDIESLCGLPAGYLSHDEAPVQLIAKRSVARPPTSGRGEVIDFRDRPNERERQPELSPDDAPA